MQSWPDYRLAILRPLQRVMHAAARLVLDLKPRDHVTTALMQLHWLPIEYRIWFQTLPPGAFGDQRSCAGVFDKTADRCR
jgi:hypothetical protein